MTEHDNTIVGDNVEAFIRRYVALSDDQATALTLWCIHTHAFEAAESTPYIAVSSVGPGCGKTRTLEVLELLVSNPFLTGKITGPALARKLDADACTLLLDETDALFTSAGAQQVLRGILNSGYRLGGKTCFAKGQGVVELNTFTPKAFAGIGAGSLPRTVMDRSIPIVLRKRGAFESVERLRQREVRGEARIPRMMAARFAAQHLERLRLARPDIPRELDDRAADVWEPLLGIADALGGEWPARARHAAVELCSARAEADTDGLAFRLLGACRDVFVALDADRLKTQTLLEWLVDGGEFGDIDGRPLDARMLADTLRPFGVGPAKLKFGRQALQGYERRSFAAAWRLLGDLDEVPAVGSVPEVVAVPA